MILHECPQCHVTGLYGQPLGEPVHCHSCGGTFVLSGYTKVDKSPMYRFIEAGRLKAESIRQSRKLLYAVGAVSILALVWLFVSAFGWIPDGYRLVNRRFATVEAPNRLAAAVGVIGIADEPKSSGTVLTAYCTTVAISPDGYLLTTKAVLPAVLASRAWAFIGGKRLDLTAVGADTLADIALLKADGEFSYHFRVPADTAEIPVNSGVLAVGYQAPNTNKSPTEWKPAVTSGSISRVFASDIGTTWIEHSAALSTYGAGGPLILNDELIGLNVSYRNGLTRSVSLVQYRSKISRWISEFEKKLEGGN